VSGVREAAQRGRGAGSVPAALGLPDARAMTDGYDRQRLKSLARMMVRLERQACEALDSARASELWARREQHHRSRLMREAWARRRMRLTS
jgi:hypothetical protein